MVATDQADRDRLRGELDTTFFVEAGAGTGKTRELVARIVSLVAADSLTMQGLVAITFTEAAAAELRDRIRRELAHAGREEARDIDLAQVQTIHAFAGALLRAFPLEARLPPGFVIWDEMQRDRDFDERFRAWLYDEIPSREDSTRRRAVARALALGLQPERLKMLAHRLQEHYDLLAPGQVWQRAATPDAVEVANASGRALLNLEPLLLYARNAQEDDLVREVRSLAFTAERLADAHAESEAYEALTRYLLRRPTTTRGRVAEWGPHPTHGNAATFIKRTLRSTTEQIEACIGAHRAAAISDLLGYLTDFTLDYAQDRKYRGVATFHDLLVWARDLLRDHPLARGIASARIQRLFVDEFQDTDPLQAELIVYLCADPTLSGERDWRALLDHLTPGKLFVVGDPKQSIYRFRRAEVAVYQRVYQASASAGAARASLAQTFRSVGPIVAWLNEFFSSVMRRDQGVQAEYTRLAARPALDGFEVDDERCGVRVMGGADDRGAGERWTAEADAIARVARKAVAEAWPVTEQIDDNWRARPCQFKDICVLLPTRTNLRRLERAFEANGVPYRMESGSLVVFTQEVRDLIACARAIEDPSDQVALVAALRSPAYACSDVDLLAWVEAGGYLSYLSPGIELDGVVGRAMASLSDFHRQRSERSAAATIEALIRDRALGLQAMGHPRPREALRRQRYVVAQARKLASAGDPTLRGFVHWIETLRKNELYDAESAVPDSDEDAVRLMTVHGSKGLEFPIVILSGLGGGVRSNDGVQLLASHTSGHIEARLTARVGPAFQTPEFDAQHEKRLEQAEQLRLLYVAATRAREHLVLSLFHSPTYGRASHAAAIVGWLAPRMSGGPARIDLATLPAFRPPPPPGPADADDTSSEEHARAEAEWVARRAQLLNTLGAERLVTPSSLAHEAMRPEVRSADDESLSPTRASRAATALGRAVHSTLQWIELETLSDLPRLAEVFAAEEAVEPTEVARLARQAALSEPVTRALASGRYWREVPIEVDVDGVLLEGAIDLVYEDADGGLVVVDYKTDRVPVGGVADRAREYAAQVAAYSRALSRATRRPVRRAELVFAASGADGVAAVIVHEPPVSGETGPG